jgi:cytochrome b pre-mRNA-processing protein 3
LRRATPDPNIRICLTGASRALARRSALTFLQRLFGAPGDRLALRPLYAAIVAEARDPAWYRRGGVPDTVDGRFDMVSALLALVLLRLEAEGESGRRNSVLLTELFVDDMDASLRELGTGDLMVGKGIGKLMGALGGRKASFRDTLSDASAFEASVRRNVFRDAPPSEDAVRFVAQHLRRRQSALVAVPLARLLAGEIG